MEHVVLERMEKRRQKNFSNILRAKMNNILPGNDRVAVDRFLLAWIVSGVPDRENSGHEQRFRARPGFRLGLAEFGHGSDLVRHLVRLLVSVDQVGLLRFILEGLPLVKAWEKK
jgi:hypothetical protein